MGKKHTSGFFGCGHMMQNWGFWEDSTCPVCQLPDETKVHLMTCPDAGAEIHWQAVVDSLEVWM